MSGRRRFRMETVDVVTWIVLTGIAVLSRAAFVMLPHIKPIAGFVMITGISLGPLAGFLSGACASFLSNALVASQGPWTPWQMAAFAIGGLVMAILVRRTGMSAEKRFPVALVGGLLTLCVIGPVLDTSSLVSGASHSIEAAGQIYRAGLRVNLLHAATTFVTLFLFAKPIEAQVRRIRGRYSRNGGVS